MKNYAMAAIAAWAAVYLGCGGAVRDDIGLCAPAPQCQERVEACGLEAAPDGDACVLENGEEGVCHEGACGACPGGIDPDSGLPLGKHCGPCAKGDDGTVCNEDGWQCLAGQCQPPACVADDKNECTTDWCMNGVPNHADRVAGSSCMNGACDGYGTCLPGELEELQACESADFRSGWIVKEKCVECTSWICAGVPGCSANPLFAGMPSIGQCPDGCSPACPL